MKKIFQVMGLFTLICVSFFVTEKTVSVIKEQDEVMIKIDSIKDSYRVDSVDAFISGNTIIPGVMGREVDVDKSYINIKRMGYFDDKFLIYKDVLPSVSISNNYDKYINRGNPSKNSVSLVFVLKSDDKINLLRNILKDTKVNYYVDIDYLNNNLKLVKELGSESEIYNYGYLGNYSESLLIFGNNLIMRNTNNSSDFCLSKDFSADVIKVCAGVKNHTIIPNIIVDSNPYSEVKNNIVSGSIILMEINDTVLGEISNIINFITSKGYKIVGLSELLSEA